MSKRKHSKFNDFCEGMEYGVMSMPALEVNEKVVSVGKVLKSAEVLRCDIGVKI